MNSIFNRLLRGSVEDDVRLSAAGIDLRVMLKAGICPAKLLAAGVYGLPEEKLKAVGIKSPEEITEENLKALGFNSVKLNSKGKASNVINS